MRIKAILFDFVGTIVKEKDTSIVASCLSDAFVEHGIFLNKEFFNSQKRKDNIDIINEVLDQYKIPLLMAPAIYDLFAKNLKNNVENFIALEDTLLVFSHLLRIGVSIGIRTNLPKEVFDAIYFQLGWTKRAISYTGFLGEMDNARSTSDIILDMMSKMKIENTGEILTVSNSIDNFKEEKNIGCKTAVLLSDTQLLEELIKERPDFLLNSLPNVVNRILMQNVKVNEGYNNHHRLVQL